MTFLRGQGNSPRSTERLTQAGKHRQIDVQRDTFQATNAERGESVVQLQVPERAPHGSTATIEVAEALSVAGDGADWSVAR